MPAVVNAAVNGSAVTLTLSPSTDKVALKGWLVHRDRQFVRFAPAGTTFVDTDVTPGAHDHQVRAQDTSNNNSAPARRDVTV